MMDYSGRDKTRVNDEIKKNKSFKRTIMIASQIQPIPGENSWERYRKLGQNSEKVKFMYEWENLHADLPVKTMKESKQNSISKCWDCENT